MHKAASTRKGTRRQNIHLFAVLLLLAANMFLVTQNLRLRQSVNALYRLSPLTPLHAGDSVHGFRAELNGTLVNISYENEADAPAMLLFLSPSCEFCDQQVPMWAETIAAHASAWNILALVRDSEDRHQVERYMEARNLTAATTLFVQPVILSAYKLSRTPTTVLVDTDGIVLGAWEGVWDDRVVAEIQTILDGSSPQERDRTFDGR